MIDIIISAKSDATLPAVEYTLYSIAPYDAGSVIIVVDDSLRDVITADTINKTLPLNIIIVYHENRISEESHIANFFQGLQIQGNNINPYVLFLKAGDTLCGQQVLFDVIYHYLLQPYDEEEDRNDNNLIIIGNVLNNSNFSLYSENALLLQGIVFNRNFLEYYFFDQEFNDDIEFALLTYFVLAQENCPYTVFHYDHDFVSLNDHNKLRNIGLGCRHFFEEFFPDQPFFNAEKGISLIYQIIVKSYITYIEAINYDIPIEEMQNIIADILSFYSFFKGLELNSLELLLDKYNALMKEVYTSPNNAFIKTIPSLTFIEFLDEMNKLT